MKCSNLPFWVRVGLGVFNAALPTILLWLWWPAKESRKQWWLWAGAVYFFLFWLYMRW